MYDAFASFMAHDTWYTRASYDEQRFYRCLSTVIADPEFDPETLRSYMMNVSGADPNDPDDHFRAAISRYVSDAWAIKDYLKTIYRGVPALP